MDHTEWWQSRGAVLRWWRRDVAGLSQRDLADRLQVSRTTITNWESDARLASLDPARIDEALDAGGVLASLLWALGTTGGLAPAKLWSQVFPGESSTVWAWVRGTGAQLSIVAEWGLYRMSGDFEIGSGGLFITVGASIEDSPVMVHLSQPGWVDFGRGGLPADAVGVPVVDAVDLWQPGSAVGGFNAILSSTLSERFRDELPNELADLGPDAAKPLEAFIGSLDTHGVHHPVWPPESEGIEDLDRARFRRLREARQLSLPETVERLRDLTGTKIGKDTLRRFENATGEPHDGLLPAALDHALGGNGHIAMMKISSGEGDGAVTFPPYWNAPVWLAFEGRQTTPVAELEWGAWHRRVDGELPLLVINHAAMTPLRIRAERGVTWTAGIGRQRGAVPIHQGWVPDGVDTTQEALSVYREVLVDAIRHAGGDRKRR